MSIRYELYVKPDYNFIHWLRDESNNYKGYRFWSYFTIKKININKNGITIDFFQVSEEGKPHVTYHYFTDKFNFDVMWNFTIYDNLTQAWRYLDVPQFFNSFNEVLDSLLIYYKKKINYLQGQLWS